MKQENIPTSIENRVFQEISIKGIGKIHHLSDFFHITNEAAIRKAFQRLEKENKLVRLARGIYLFPKRDQVLGVLYPSTAEIAKDIAKREKLRLIPTGDQALLQLGLSTQVPMTSVYLTDGGPRQINLGNRKLVFKTTTPKMLSLKGNISTLVIQALKSIGKNNLTREIKDLIKKQLHKENLIFAEADAMMAPAWIREFILNILIEIKSES